jgi:hypothetical protein
VPPRDAHPQVTQQRHLPIFFLLFSGEKDAERDELRFGFCEIRKPAEKRKEKKEKKEN